MKKIVLIGCIISLTAITGSVFAADDCDLVGINIDNALAPYASSNYKGYQNAVPIEGFKQALLHLKAYCCAQVVQTCTKEETEKLPKFYPGSPYFFDHLIDISMRRLDGNKELAYGLEPDSTALERRKKITNIANNPTGVQASTIEKIYKEYWTPHTNTTKNKDTVLANYGKNNLETLSLLDKYSTICGITRDLYETLKTSNKTIIGSYGDSNSFFNRCENMVKERVKRENGYVKILMVQKANKLFDESNKAYTKKYFVEEKMMGLWNLVNKVKDLFQTVVQQAPVSKSCSL